jgi:hypothetical protein
VRRPLSTRLIGLVACAAVTVAAGARAQDTAAAQKEADRASAFAKKAQADLQAAQKTAEKTPATRASGGKKVIKLDALTVEGRIQKPEAFYVLPRSSLNFDELQKSESFVTKIDKSVLKDPF